MTKIMKVLGIVLCIAALIGTTVAATVAFLSMKTAPVQNTFTAGDIKITLEQANLLENQKMVPGTTFTADPVVTVSADSEDCYLFVKIEKTEDFDNYLEFTVAEGWSALAGENGVYYRVVTDGQKGTGLNVIASNTITAKADTTKDAYNKITSGEVDQPNLTLTAYAVQFAGMADVAEAWGVAKALDTTTQS